jgi:PPOX class probable F420-dependent enzyme
MLDLTQPNHAHADRRLRAEPIIWLGTVRPDGRPHLVPIWFLWDGATVLMFSKPGAQKVRNLRRSPAVTLALDSADEGEDIVVIEGQAALLPSGAITSELPAYAAKYAALLTRIGSSAAKMAVEYSQAISVAPTKIVAWSS